MPGFNAQGLWRERLRRYERSGLTVAEFCDREDVSTASFYQWRRRLAEMAARPRPQGSVARQCSEVGPSFQQVTLSGVGGVVAIELPSGVRVELPAHHVQLVQAVVADLVRAEPGRLRGDA
jgi:hypothetical protein